MGYRFPGPSRWLLDGPLLQGQPDLETGSSGAGRQRHHPDELALREDPTVFVEFVLRRSCTVSGGLARPAKTRQARSRRRGKPIFEKLARLVVEDRKFGGGRRRAGFRRWSGPARCWIEEGSDDKRPDPAVGGQSAARDFAVPGDASRDHIGWGVRSNCCPLQRRQSLGEGKSARRGKLEGRGGRRFAHRDDRGSARD